VRRGNPVVEIGPPVKKNLERVGNTLQKRRIEHKHLLVHAVPVNFQIMRFDIIDDDDVAGRDRTYPVFDEIPAGAASHK